MTLIKKNVKELDSVPEILDVLKTFPQITDADHVLADPVETLVRKNLRQLTGDAGFTTWLAPQPHVHQIVLGLVGQLFGILDDVLSAHGAGCQADYFFFRDDEAARRSCASCKERTQAVDGDLIEKAFGGDSK